MATTHLVGGFGQQAHRPGDGAGEIQGQQHGRRQHHQKHVEDVDAHVAQRRFDAGVVARDHQRAKHLAVALHRHRDRQNQPSVGRVAHLARFLAAQCRDRFGIIRRGGIGNLAVERMVIAERQEIDHEVVGIDQRFAQTVDARRRQVGELNGAEAGQHLAVGDHVAGRGEQAHPDIGRGCQAAHHRPRLAGQKFLAFGSGFTHRRFAESGGDDFGLHGECVDLGLDQAVAVAIEIKQTHDQRRQRQHVERQNAPGQRAHAPRQMQRRQQSAAQLRRVTPRLGIVRHRTSCPRPTPRREPYFSL